VASSMPLLDGGTSGIGLQGDGSTPRLRSSDEARPRRSRSPRARDRPTTGTLKAPRTSLSPADAPVEPASRSIARLGSEALRPGEVPARYHGRSLASSPRHGSLHVRPNRWPDARSAGPPAYGSSPRTILLSARTDSPPSGGRTVLAVIERVANDDRLPRALGAAARQETPCRPSSGDRSALATEPGAPAPERRRGSPPCASAGEAGAPDVSPAARASRPPSRRARARPAPPLRVTWRGSSRRARILREHAARRPRSLPARIADPRQERSRSKPPTPPTVWRSALAEFFHGVSPRAKDLDRGAPRSPPECVPRSSSLVGLGSPCAGRRFEEATRPREPPLATAPRAILGPLLLARRRGAPAQGRSAGPPHPPTAPAHHLVGATARDVPVAAHLRTAPFVRGSRRHGAPRARRSRP